MYNHLVESCFDKCVMTEWGGVSKSLGSIFIDRILMVVAFRGFIQGFSSKQLNETESKCITHCSEKFMKLTQRAGFRFAENQALKGAQLQQQQK